jgi:thiamine-monophosphate kinase
MGGEPKYAFLSMALPKSTDYSWTCFVIDGVKEACDKWDILLLGGDTVGSKRDMFLNLTLIGSAVREKIKYRNKARSGDIICVSGYLGDSGGGLKALQQKTIRTSDVERLIHSHFRPEPSPKQGLWLAAHREVHAMMDISDGLDCDLTRLMKRSAKGAVIETNLIPISISLSKVSAREGWDALQLALVGGEDYCLLLTVASEAFEDLRSMFQKTFNCPLFPIGNISEKSDGIIYCNNERRFRLIIQITIILNNAFSLKSISVMKLKIKNTCRVSCAFLEGFCSVSPIFRTNHDAVAGAAVVL